MVTQDHHDRHPRRSSYLPNESGSAARATESTPGGAWIERASASARPVHRRTDRPLLVSRRDHPGLDVRTDRQYLDRPSLSLEADAGGRLEAVGNAVWSVPWLHRWLATHTGMFGDRRRRREDASRCASPFLVLGVTAQPSLTGTQARTFNAATQGSWCRRFKPAVRFRSHLRCLRRKPPQRSGVTGDTHQTFQLMPGEAADSNLTE